MPQASLPAVLTLCRKPVGAIFGSLRQVSKPKFEFPPCPGTNESYLPLAHFRGGFSLHRKSQIIKLLGNPTPFLIILID